jgi:hypothetical protein
MAEELNIDVEMLEAILDYFEKLKLFSFTFATYGYALFFSEVAAHDFFRHGGFVAQEELLKKNLKKLILEIESLKPTVPEKAATLSTIVSAVTSALALFH